jgi:hypothetical protein
MPNTLLRLLARPGSTPIANPRPARLDDEPANNHFSSAGFHASSHELLDGIEVRELGVSEWPLDIWMDICATMPEMSRHHRFNA